MLHLKSFSSRRLNKCRGLAENFVQAVPNRCGWSDNGSRRPGNSRYALPQKNFLPASEQISGLGRNFGEAQPNWCGGSDNEAGAQGTPGTLHQSFHPPSKITSAFCRNFLASEISTMPVPSELDISFSSVVPSWCFFHLLFCCLFSFFSFFSL